MYVTDCLEDIYNNTELTTEEKKQLILDRLNAKLVDGSIDLNYAGRCGWTHLMVAVQRNDFVTAQWLLDHGVDINQGNNFGITPLHIAAENQDDSPDMVNFLIERGASVHPETSGCDDSMTGRVFNGETPIIFAVRRGNFNIFRTLFDNHLHRVGRIDEVLKNALTTARTILALLEAEDQTITNICVKYKHLNRNDSNSWWNSEKRTTVATNRNPALTRYIGMTSIDPEPLRQIIQYPTTLSNLVRNGVHFKRIQEEITLARQLPIELQDHILSFLDDKDNFITTKINKAVLWLGSIKEKTQIERQLPPGLLTFIPIPTMTDDGKCLGHCLFNAVALYDGNTVQNLRNRVADEIQRDLDRYQPIIAALTNRTTAEYIEAVRNNEWADNLEIAVLMRVLNRPIYIIGNNGQIINQADIDVTVDRTNPIFVHYNGYNHYNGLVNNGQLTGEQVLQQILNQAQQELRPVEAVEETEKSDTARDRDDENDDERPPSKRPRYR